MNVIVAIPDDLAARFASESEISRRAIEALALEEHRAGRLSRYELGDLLGLGSEALEVFLQAHGLGAGANSESQVPDRRKAADDLVSRFQAFADRHRLGGLGIKTLISEGRRSA